MKREQRGVEVARGIAEELARITADNARLLARLREGEGRFRSIARGVVRVQEAERGRIARELHDSVGQSLTALKMQLDLLADSAAREESPTAPRLAELRELAAGALEDVRQLSRLLRPQMLDELGLLPTLQWLIRAFQKQTGIEVELTHARLEEIRDPEVETLVFRIAQEGLTNVAKHARARSVALRLRCGEGRLSLELQDSGAGFDAAGALACGDESLGFGLRGMRDRVSLLGGRFAVRSAPAAGTTLAVELPLEDRAESR